MVNLKNILNLFEKKIICDKGKEGSESFCLRDKENETIILEDEVCNENTMINDPVEEYINIKFYEILINKIKEVKNTVDTTQLKKLEIIITMLLIIKIIIQLKKIIQLIRN